MVRFRGPWCKEAPKNNLLIASMVSSVHNTRNLGGRMHSGNWCIYIYIVFQTVGRGRIIRVMKVKGHTCGWEVSRGPAVDLLSFVGDFTNMLPKC